MHALPVDLTLVGGPTVLIEVAGVRLLTDPTFDGPGVYKSGSISLQKTQGPAITPETLGPVDAILLSHDQHPDNLDPAGRAYALKTHLIVTTPAGAKRLGSPALGLETWRSTTVSGTHGVRLTVIAVPARHGPPGAERLLGDVTGFVVQGPDRSDLVYVTGDTVYYDGVAEVARRFHPKVVVVFAGAARTRGPFGLTMGNDGLLELAHTFPKARIVAVHNEGWGHFTESPADIAKATAVFGLDARVTTLTAGRKTTVSSEAAER